MRVRRITEEDCEDLLAWRNDVVTRANSRNMKRVSRREHLSWFAASLRNPDRVMYVGLEGATKIGTVRFDLLPGLGSQYYVSITVSPLYRGLGYGKGLLMSAMHELGGSSLVADIKETNEASKRLFAACGFEYRGPSPYAGLNRYALEGAQDARNGTSS